MKRLISVLFALSIIPTAFAEKLIITYDFNNRLQSVEIYREDGKYSVAEGSTAFLYDPFAETREKFTPKPQHAENISGAIDAPAVVTEVYKTTVADEIITVARVLYNGAEQDFYIEDDVVIETAPEAYSNMAGKTADALMAGDVINISTYFSGGIRAVNLIARLGDEEIITSDTDWGENFEKLYGAEGVVNWGGRKFPICSYGKETDSEVAYQFGVIYYTADDYYLLTNRNGKAEEFERVGISPETNVYICDMSDDKNAEIADIYAIEASFMTSESIDENENIVKWDSENDYIYALSRTAKGVASDVVIFRNFK